NGDVAVTLSSDTLTLTGVPVVKSYGGGCAVANGPSNDPFLLIILGALLLLLIRRRYMLNITTSFQC
ncbi:JDVT-CTERM domain-containing protein, partial [Porticoccaceae bacterium]|nr:JDVT-CTERM domain-containing protein [Porticoccaceae bacterium]